MKKGNSRCIKKKIALAAVIIGGILCFLTVFFVQGVQKQLWEQSINTIMESTRQGCNTLKIQLRDDYESMDVIAKYVKEFSPGQKGELEALLDTYVQVDNGISLYLPDGICIPEKTQRDSGVETWLAEHEGDHGIINPHISSVTGVNVFNLFVKIMMKDGQEGYLLKEYEVDGIVDSFSLSFYNNTGFSYVVNAKGDILIRSPHPQSNKTVKNLFDMLPAERNDADSLTQFKTALKNAQTGWAVFTYQEEETVFCYIPLKLQSDWFLISIIPQKVVNAQTNEILGRSLALTGSIVLGILLLVIFYFRYVSKTNKKLSNQADYIGNLYNAVPEGVALITVEPPYRFIQLNKEGLRLLRYPENSLNDAPKGKYLKKAIPREEYDKVAQIFQSTATNHHKNSFQNRVIREDGSLFWASGIVEKTLDEDGNPVLIAAFHDITDEKLAKEAAEREKLQERITLVGAISNAYPVIISMNLTKDALNFIYVKPKLMMGLGTQKAYSELFKDMIPTIHPDNRDEFKRRFSPETLQKTLGQEKNEVFFEVKQMLTDGNYHWISTQIIYVDNPYSQDKLAILMSRRVDEQRHEEEQQRYALQSALESARMASEAKSQFLSNMSHDIRTPMNAITGMTAIAIAHLDDRERVMECLKKISLSSKHLLGLVNDVLDMSKIESGKLSLRSELFNFAELVADSVELVRSQANANKLTMHIHMAALKNEKVIGDSLRIRQVCINILSNAVKYTPSGGSIHIEVRQENSSRKGYQNYIFRCADTGIGMDAEFLEKLFQPFERAQSSMSNKMTGTGLGMAITKNVVDLMNGNICVESNPGKGSVFTVIFPLQVQDTQNEEVPQEWVGVHSLMVDDDLQTCENAAELLEDMGLRVKFVTKGEAAIEYIMQAKNTSDPVQLVIVDWKMPDMDGVEVTRLIRSELGLEIPVMILTAYDWSEIEYEAREAGVTAFLSKPFYRSKICYLLSELSGEKNEPSAEYLGDESDYRNKRVLLVEDNEINREIAKTLIGEMGIQIEEAYDGVEAVKKVSDSAQGYYDLILMDIQMPRMNGYEAVKAIRELHRQDAKQVPVVAMTANAFEDDVRAALKAGMNAHLAKPIDVEALEQMLRRYLLSPPSEE